MRPDAHRDLKQLRSVTLRGTEHDRLLARLRLERALDAVDWTPRGLPAGALLLVRRLVATRGARTTLARTVTQALHEHSRNARRPWLDERAADAEAVWFDRGELAACLARDALRGRVSQRWWWPSVLDGRDPDQWLREQVLDHGERVVSLLAMLCGRGDAVAWLRRLPDHDAVRGLEALVRDYAVPSVEHSTRRPHLPDLDDRNIGVAPGMRESSITAAASTTNASTNAAAHSARASDSTFASSRAVARLLAAAPELLTARLRSPAQRLLAHARMAMHDPNWLRSQAFVGTLHRWIDSQAAIDDEPAGADRIEPATGTIRHTGSSASSPTRIADSSELLASGPSDKRQATAQDQKQPRPSFDVSSQPLITATEPSRSATPAPVDTRVIAKDRNAQTRIEPDAADHTANTDTAQTENLYSPIIDPAAEPATELDKSPAPLSSDAVGDDYTARSIVTDFGGLLYLLNVALALDLYGDFSSPRTPGIPLSPWDWLAMIGRAWFGASFRSDPLDLVLAQLAGRDANQRPGIDFDPGRDWSMPDAWLRPWGEIDRLSHQVDANRLRIWHPQGFVVFDQPRDRDLPPATQAAALCATREHLRGATLQRITRLPLRARSRQPAQAWLDRLLPYLRVRIALALGMDAHDADLPAQVCRHPARMQCDLTHVDVQLSLATLPLSLRIAGLDRDPGWIPAAGRSIRFHFDAAGFDSIGPGHIDRAGDRA